MTRTRYLLCALFVILRHCNCHSVSKPSLDSSNSTIGIANDDTTEIHRTMCRITTERLVANAQATFTRVLTGACNAKTIDERFEKLENTTNKRFDEMKELILRETARERNILCNEKNSRRNFVSGSQTIDERFERMESSTNKRLDEIKDMILLVMTRSSNYVDISDDYRNKRIATANNKNSPDVRADEFQSNRINNALPPMRRDEVKRFNNSIHDISIPNDQRKVYTYYWRVSNLNEKYLKWKTGRSERSSTFYVGDNGYAMYLRFTPKYFPDGTIFVSVGLTMGLHDSQLAWPFALPIRIEILDVSSSKKPEDRSSRLWDPATVCTSNFWGRPGTFGESNNPECVGLSIPRQLLIGKQTEFVTSFDNQPAWKETYVWNDSLLVKLSVHL